MKILRNTTFLLVGCAVLFSSSCKKWVEDINVSPNNATDAPLSAIMTATYVGAIQPNSGEDARLAGVWTQQFTGTDRQYSGYDAYNISSADFDWDGPYYSVTQQANIAIAKAQAEGNKFYEGTAMVLKSLSFGMTAAAWGDIPYSQANDIVNFPSPQFDNQLDVYAGVQADLDAAIVALTDGTGGDAFGVDFYFSGDAAKWIAAAHTLKARFYMHTGEFAKAETHATQGVMTSDGNWMIPHTGGAYNQDMNLYHSFGVFDRQGYMTAPGAYLPEALNPDAAKQNPSWTGVRRNHAKTDESERFAYIYAGDTSDTYDLNYSGMWQATSSFPVVTALENLLIIAEIEANKSAAAGVTALNKARAELTAMFPAGTYSDFAESDFASGAIEDNGGSDAQANLLYEIYEEKYTSLVGQMEVFNDFRRLKNPLGIAPKLGTVFPQRYLTPQDELDGNLNAPSPLGLFEPTEANK
jgi:hypothetical protein